MLKFRKYFYTLSVVLVLSSIASLAIFGLNFGTDFNGGSIMEVRFQEERPGHNSVKSALADFELGEIIVQNADENGIILRFREVNPTLHQGILNKIETLGVLEEQRFESIGPAIGEETKRKALWSIGLVLITILIYVAWAFRKISFPLRSWTYGVVALIALFHDVLIAVGIFAALGYFMNIEVGIPFVAAILTILGYSVNDTIVVFDRIRENILTKASDFNFGELINKSLAQTYVRSLNTSLTTFFVLFAIFMLGGATIKYFVLTLIIGVAVGTYSSIFLASPLLFSWYLVQFKKSEKSS